MTPRTFEEALPIWRDVVVRETGRDPYPQGSYIADIVRATSRSHSALLSWLMDGNDPLPEPPPVMFSHPCHRMAVDGHTEGWFDAWKDGTGHVYIGQRPWAILVNSLPDGSLLVRPTRHVDGEQRPYGDTWRLYGSPVREYGQKFDGQSAFDEVHKLRRISPPPKRVAELFRGPFRREFDSGYIRDADLHTTVTDFHDGEGPIPRSWGRIQYLPDAEALMDEWAAYFEVLIGDETDLNVIAALLTYAWPYRQSKARRDNPPKKRSRGRLSPILGAAMAMAGVPVVAGRSCSACFDLQRCTNGRVTTCSKCQRRAV